MKPKNRIVQMMTPFMFAAIYLFVASIYLLITGGHAWGDFFGTVGLFITTIIVIVHMILKKAIKKYRQIFITELIIVAFVILYIYMN